MRLAPWLAGLLLLGAAAPASAGERVRLAIYHTNDVHGWIYPREASWHKADPKRRVGGFAALAELVKRERLPKLLLDGGDWFQGTPEGSYSRGLATAECMNALRYDAVAIGNHDFDFGEEQLRRVIGALRMPALGSNIYREADGRRPEYVTPHLIREVAGVTVGLFGLLTTQMPTLAFEKDYRGLRFRREVDEARDMVRQLKAKGATVIIAVTHIGFLEPGMGAFEDEKFLAAEVPGIDVVVGGHTHSRLHPPVHERRNGTLVAQAGCYLSQAGRIELEIDRETGRVVGSTGTLHELWLDELGEDPAVQAVVARYQDEADRQLRVVVATAADTLSRNRSGEASVGDWLTDCTREWAGTQVAFQNNGGIRADIPAGPVTLRHLFELMPFDNRVATLTLTGAQLRETLEFGVSSASRGALQMSGVKLRYRPRAADGGRLTDVRVGEEKLRDDARYTVATVDFLVQRGDGYAALGRGEGTTVTETLQRDVLGWCAKRRGVLRASPRDRIVPEVD
ncbi:MAG: bifunctional metallophosphatase/5'-nucleotidase [Elusimicrobia bacterium]|nr:bifunctional metallophosphatase/5'-nucleotidase [Elusimicrobiota bacterium]